MRADEVGLVNHRERLYAPFALRTDHGNTGLRRWVVARSTDYHDHINLIAQWKT